ncbi:chemotaxis protein MotB [Nannocystis exedens]|uniref:Chemotaxis protein MotB n=1 Tax=Nannocystis exedens TaxID=54 RepID=A0A1I2GXK6_9BACT|nr:OmpA family protein [Nannocystis exedens]PCC68897.1 chemotaxis protein MotB [Nannocystis exedens]SFF22152.1 chemotaxis protein MotB [Nannocystis exedens]
MPNKHLRAVFVIAAFMAGPACGAQQPTGPAAGPSREGAPEADRGPDPRVQALEEELSAAKRELDALKTESEQLRKSETELKAKADEAEALQKKLTEVVGKFGDVTTEDGMVRVELVDKILFPVGEADLTDNGREVLAQVGAALKDIEDKQVWVQGHTDDSPIVIRKPKKGEDPKAKKGDKNAKDAKDAKADAKAAKEEATPEPNDAVLPFVTNWELSAARALTVVHYLQDEAKIDPSRLAAVAFGQYRPSSKSKAKNRRIEIVLYPRAKLAPK